jgi:group I intron endonuclease
MSYIVRIYKIVNSVTDDTYVGSTKQALCKRMGTHRYHSKIGRRAPLYYQYFQVLGVENFKIVLLESCEVSCRDEQNAVEQRWMDELKPSINRQRATCTEDDKRAYRIEYRQRDYVKAKESKRNSDPQRRARKRLKEA